MKVILSLLSVLFISASLSAQQGEKPEGWLTHTDTSAGFALYYPGDWDLKLPGTGTRFFITSQKESDKDRFRENINCITRDLGTKNFDIADAEETIKNTLAEKLAEFKVIKSMYITWNNAKTLRLEYTCVQESDGEKYNIHMLQYMSVINGMLYTFTFTSEDASYGKYVGTVLKIYLSMEIK